MYSVDLFRLLCTFLSIKYYSFSGMTLPWNTFPGSTVPPVVPSVEDIIRMLVAGQQKIAIQNLLQSQSKEQVNGTSHDLQNWLTSLCISPSSSPTPSNASTSTIPAQMTNENVLHLQIQSQLFSNLGTPW